VDALEAGNDCHLLAFTEALEQFAAIDIEDAGGRMGVGSNDWQLPTLPRPRRDPDRLQRDGEQARRDLLARCHHGIVFTGVMQRRRFATPFHKPVGGSRHGRDHDGDLMTGVDLTLDMACDVADPLDIGHRGAAEFHDQSSHDDNSNPLCRR
jgi:hypothetical protein